MKNDPLGINPPAIVKKADRSLNDIFDSIENKLGVWVREERFQIDRARELGEEMLAAKERIMHGGFKAALAKRFPDLGYQVCRRFMKVAEKWEEVTQKFQRETFDSVAEFMRLLAQDSPEDEAKGASGSVPFAPNGQPAKPPETAPEREPGDMTPEEEEQERIERETEEMLCKDCKRKGDGKTPLPACKLCNGKVEDIRAGKKVKPGVRTTPNDPRDHKPKNGTPLFLWPDYHHDFGKFKQQIDKLCNGYGVPIVHPTAEELRRRADTLNNDVRAFAQEISKQRVPEV